MRPIIDDWYLNLVYIYELNSNTRDFVYSIQVTGLSKFNGCTPDKAVLSQFCLRNLSSLC